MIIMISWYIIQIIYNKIHKNLFSKKKFSVYFHKNSVFFIVFHFTPIIHEKMVVNLFTLHYTNILSWDLSSVSHVVCSTFRATWNSIETKVDNRRAAIIQNSEKLKNRRNDWDWFFKTDLGSFRGLM
jgi:hypothetical protein